MGIENKFKGEGGYIFVSHSHNDITDVREVRNYLENEGFEPILFFLKSMDTNDDSKTNILKRLIYDEIDARQFFLYLDSENARNSKWVSEELAYVRKNHPDRLFSVDLKKAKDEILFLIDALVKQMRIFISCNYKDDALAKELKNILLPYDFRVFLNCEDMLAGSNWASVTADEIKIASEKGLVLAIVTKNYLNSKWALYELNVALEYDGRIVPIIVGDVKLEGALKHYLATRQHLTLPENYTRGQLNELASKIRRIARGK
jgi:hypothetical protein